MEIRLNPITEDNFVDAFHLRLAQGQEARKWGACALYASCCSAEETINFYSAMGFRLSPNPIPFYVEDEPSDPQMECAIV